MSRATVFLLLLSACGSKEIRKYDNSLFQLGSGFAAKEACSCRFVMERDEAFCSEWVRVSPDLGRFEVDEEAKEVSARTLGMGRAKARFIDDEVGCRIVESKAKTTAAK